MYMDNNRNKIHCVCLKHENISDTFIEVLCLQFFLSWLSNDVKRNEYQMIIVTPGSITYVR